MIGGMRSVVSKQSLSSFLYGKDNLVCPRKCKNVECTVNKLLKIMYTVLNQEAIASSII